jgi:hypothetical protein
MTSNVTFTVDVMGTVEKKNIPNIEEQYSSRNVGERQLPKWLMILLGYLKQVM